MIAETGHFALVLALVIALVQGILPLIGAQRGHQPWVALAAPAAGAQFVFVAIAFSCLTVGYLTSDFSIVNVAENSHSAKPLLYKISGVWGNHEGSLLLWILILALFGAMVALFGRNLPPDLRARVLAIQGLIGVGFLLFILFTSNPFGRLDPPPLDGQGLNPLLQDPGLAFHPPFLYLGYVGLSVSFSFAIAALIEGRIDPAWARWVRPWTLVAWCFLTGGIALGSWWAYYELGWGGWWFWDPVENASFMPWLVATALLHSAIVVEKRDALKSWTILLAIIAFSFSLLGTFLVRSGVLNSVHAFATDPSRGIFVLIFLFLVTGGALALYAFRAPTMQAGGLFAPISREGGLVLNNLLLTTAAATVLLGTLYPLFLDALSGEKVSVGPPYFNATFIPLMTPLILLMAVGPLLTWKRADAGAALARLKAALVAAAVIAGIAWWLLADGPVLALLGMALFAWLAVGVLVELAERLRLFRVPFRDSWRRARLQPRAAYGMTIAHLGMAFIILGITASETWQSESLTVMRPGESVELGGYSFTFDGARSARGPNYDTIEGDFIVRKDSRLVARMKAETRTFSNPPMQTTEAAIRPTAFADLYVVIGEPDGRGGYATRIYYKPLVSWIWFGALVMMLGGFVSLSDRRLRIGAPRQRQAVAGAVPAE
ncbi:heme lyase CcmF/NrfE family subunit [Oceanibacterium hippocampi]|uniref:Cytochrome c-type biogenesis protein CcmF n=1 Tax=Oceanibacterium hippocampi TaxID=745714 RepID=A0A1Y5RHA0_9PROT|nr:heme lyase CcmF/NrfE family subunit [Oceanibacterium hippocampi]SLN14672.1 Cytochrome c-type biogenesis protein CcmF [Oceanibacterium hippocampi]